MSLLGKRRTIDTCSKKVALPRARPYRSTMQKRIFALIAFALCAFSTFALGAADTPETRRHEAERYLQATPPKAMFEDMAEKMAVNLPPEQRAQFKATLTSNLDIPANTETM